MIDTELDEVETMIDIGGTASAVAVSRDGMTVYATEFGFGNLFVIDAQTNSIRTFISLGSNLANPEGVAIAELSGECPVPPTPRLTVALEPESTEITIDRPDALPIGGTLRIGSEIVTYRSITSRTLREVTRGVLGTVATPHPVGALVELVGQTGDADCDGRAVASDLLVIMHQIEGGDAGPCGGDADLNGRVEPADVDAAVPSLFADDR